MFFSKAWNGEIAVWKAVVLVSIIGYFLTFVLGSAIGIGLLNLQESGMINVNLIAINSYMISALLSVYGVFTTRTLWKSASNSKGKVGHALVKLWAVLVGCYVIAAVVKLVSYA